MPMMITSIEVYDLFGVYAYHLQFAKGLNYIHSPNGYGKSTLMQLIYSALRGDVRSIEETPFSRLDIRFDDGSALIIEKNQGDMLIQMQKNELESPVTAEEMAEICRINYIPPERTVIRKGDGHLVPAVESYAKELSESIRSAKEHSALSPCDTSWLAGKGDAELDGIAKDLKAKMDFLADAGFVPEIPPGYRFPPSRYELGENREGYIGIMASLKAYVDANAVLAESVVVFKDIINDVFINKTIDITESGKIVVNLSNGDSIPLSKLSSGEKEMLIIFYNLLFHTDPGSVVILDEPEISLHVSWQQRMGGFFTDICRVRDLQMIVATHSPQIIHDRWDQAVELIPDDARVPDLGRSGQPDLHDEVRPQGADNGGGGVVRPQDVCQIRPFRREHPDSPLQGGRDVHGEEAPDQAQRPQGLRDSGQ